jgi:hypothetical protein
MPYSFVTSLSLFGALNITPALADSYKFTMHHDSKYAITGFETSEDNKRSA